MAITVTRLDLLKFEREQIQNLQCLRLDVKDKALEHYDHEIECIEKYGSANPVYTK